MTQQLVHIPFHGGEILAVDVNGKPHVVLKPFIEALGIDYRTQLRKTRSRSWAVVGETPTTGADGKTYTMTTVDVRTALMLLATINENNVPEDKRQLLIAYQAEVADVIEAYWTKGGAINPRATEDQLDALARHARGQMEVLRLAQGLVDPRWLEGKVRIVTARALGEAPEIPAEARPLYVEDYLRAKGLGNAEAIGTRSLFGRRLARLYFDTHGRRPEKVPGDVGPRIRDINAYTEADRPLFDRVWAEHFADAFADDLLAGAPA